MEVLGLILMYGIVFPIILSVITYNKLVKGRNKVREAYSGIQVYLKKRLNLVENLVEVVKGYSKHEHQTLVETIKQRQEGGAALISLKAVAEQYPNLKADVQYQQLMQELTDLEDEIANTRLSYNKSTRKYNDKILSFPTNILAKWFNFKEEQYFQDETVSGQSPVTKINF
jgi:LemA protein